MAPFGANWLAVVINQADYWRISGPRLWAWSGRNGDITTPSPPDRAANPPWVWVIAAAIPLMLLAPAFWNGYPLLQSDTGGYLARWYEGYLVPSRSTVFGLYLHYGEHNLFLA